MKRIFLIATWVLGGLDGAAHAFAPGPHADPEAAQLAQALDFALMQAVAEHRACVTAEAALKAEIATLKGALATKDAAAVRASMRGIGLRAKWVMGLEDRAKASHAAVDALDDRIHQKNVALGTLVFSGKASKADLARARDFGALEQEMIEDADYHELSVAGEVRVFELAGTMQELQGLAPAVQALIGALGQAPN